MAHPLIIALVALLLIRDAYGGVWSVADAARLFAADKRSAAWGVLAGLYGVTLLVCLWLTARVWICKRRMLRRRANVWALKAHRAVAISRAVALIVTAIATLGADAVGAARALLGDRILLDESLVIAPALFVMALGWWSLYPLEKHLREAVFVRRLDMGSAIHAMPSRARYVWDQIRHGLLATLIPVAIILGWSEWIVALAEHNEGRWAWLADPARAAWGVTALQFVGAFGALVATPAILRFVWDIVPLGDGDMAKRVQSVCDRQGVRVGAALVWRTHGAMLNAAVLGLVPPLRYLLLTDALLESLPQREVEAVTAHEVGHVRRRHLPWLLVALVACFGGPIVGGLALLDAVAPSLDSQSGLARSVEAGIVALGLCAGFALLGFVSRRFEWQADAFAVQHMSGMGKRSDSKHPVITEDAADAMAQALGRVATLNGMPTHRFGWRHGSIADRQRRIHMLVGTPVNRLSIDRAVTRIKAASLVGALGVGALVMLAPAPDDGNIPNDTVHFITFQQPPP